MRYASLLAALFAVICCSAALAQTDLSAMTTGCTPYEGGAPGLYGRLTDTLPVAIECEEHFGGRYVKGYIRAGDFVFYEVAKTDCSGQWRRVTAHGRCGNPVRNAELYLHPVPKPVVQVQTRYQLVPTAPVVSTQVVERPVVVTQTRTLTERVVVPEIVQLAAPPLLPPPAITAMQGPRLGEIPVGYRINGDWRTIVSATVIAVPRPRPCKSDDGTCGPPPDGGVPSPDPGAAGDTGNPGSTPPGGSEVGGPDVGPPPPPPHGNGGSVTPPPGESPVTPAPPPSPSPTGSGNIVPNTE